MRSAPTWTMAIFLLAGCSGHDAGQANASEQVAARNFRPPPPKRPAPLPGQAVTTPLDAYVGHYPREAINGVDFYDRTEVATALDNAVGNQTISHLVRSDQGPQTPIFRFGRQIGAWGCEAHNCGGHNWALLVDPVTGRGELCYHDTSDARPTRWFSGGEVTQRSGDCPSDGKATPGRA